MNAGGTKFLSPLSQIITSLIITPGYFQNAIQYAVESNMMTREQAEGYFNLNNYMLMGLMGALIMGIITTAIVALFTRRTRKN